MSDTEGTRTPTASLNIREQDSGKTACSCSLFQKLFLRLVGVLGCEYSAIKLNQRKTPWGAAETKASHQNISYKYFLCRFWPSVVLQLDSLIRLTSHTLWCQRWRWETTKTGTETPNKISNVENLKSTWNEKYPFKSSEIASLGVLFTDLMALAKKL